MQLEVIIDIKSSAYAEMVDTFHKYYNRNISPNWVFKSIPVEFLHQVWLDSMRAERLLNRHYERCTGGCNGSTKLYGCASATVLGYESQKRGHWFQYLQAKSFDLLAKQIGPEWTRGNYQNPELQVGDWYEFCIFIPKRGRNKRYDNELMYMTDQAGVTSVDSVTERGYCISSMRRDGESWVQNVDRYVQRNVDTWSTFRVRKLPDPVFEEPE